MADYSNYQAEDFRDMCVAAGMRRAARLISRKYDQAVQQAGLTISQFSVLAALRGRAPVPLSQLAGDLGVERTTLTRNLRRMADRGWIHIQAPPDDQRLKLVCLAPAGEEKLIEALPYWDAVQQDQFVRMGKYGLSWPEVRERLAYASEGVDDGPESAHGAE